MQITWYGLSCFKITSGETTVLISPFGKTTGLNPPRGKADVVLISGEAEDAGSGFVISGEGEYEVKGILVNGFSTGLPAQAGGATVYTLNIDGVSFCHLDNAPKERMDALLEKIGEVDVLMIPVGGAHREGKKEVKTLGADEAVAVVSELEPRIVVPMYFKVPKLAFSVDGPEPFLKAMGASRLASVDKLSIKKKDLPQDETKIVLFSLA